MNPTARGATKGYVGMKWSDMYSVGPTAAASGPPSVVTAEGQTQSGTASGAGAPFAWLGLMMLLVGMYLLIRMGARLSTPTV